MSDPAGAAGSTGAADPPSGDAHAPPEGVGRWLFRNRGWLPVPLVAAMILSPGLSAGSPLALPPLTLPWLGAGALGQPGPISVEPAAGAALIALGEGVRLWAVGHIGRRSRTRGEDVGGLVAAGPYALVRNPLYIGNVLIFAGIGTLRWPWALVAVPLLCLHYRWIVRWEERNLSAQIGAPYRAYLAQVPRWWPSWRAIRAEAPSPPSAWSGREALRSERGTFVMLAIILVALALRGA